jgi:hypothetical protein
VHAERSRNGDSFPVRSSGYGSGNNHIDWDALDCHGNLVQFSGYPMTPKEIKVYAVVGLDGEPWTCTVQRKKKHTLGSMQSMTFTSPEWDYLKKAGYSVRRFRLVPDDAATETHTERETK